MAREMLGGGEDRLPGFGLSPLDEGCDVRGDLLRILAVGADVDDGVVRIVVDIGHRGQDPVNAQRPGLPGGSRAFIPAGREIACGCEGHGVREKSLRGNAHGSAALEVAGHQQGEAGDSLHAVQESGQGVRFAMAHQAALDAVHQHQPADAQVPDPVEAGCVLEGLRVRRFAIEGHNDELRNLLPQAEKA